MKQRTLTIIVVTLSVLIMVAVGSGVAYFFGHNDGLEDAEREYASREQEDNTSLYYSLIDLYNLQATPVENIRLNIMDSVDPTQFSVEKWTGQDRLMIIPKGNMFAIFAGGKLVRAYQADDPKVNLGQVTLLEDGMVVSGRQAIYKFGYDGNLISGLAIPAASHQCDVTPEGNYVIVRSGLDQVLEITPQGQIVFQWNAMEGLAQYSDANYKAWSTVAGVDCITNMYNDYRQLFRDFYEWTHVNSCQKLEDGYLIGLRNLDLVIKVNLEGEIVWSFGAGIIKHQHHPRILDNGNLLVFDNGNHRVAEFTPDQQLVWEYTDITCPIFGWCEKLANGNYLVPDTHGGRLLEVTPDKEIVKQVNTKPPFYMGCSFPIECLDWMN